MAAIKNALLLDTLLDKWDSDNADPVGTYFQKLCGLKDAAGADIAPVPAAAPNVLADPGGGGGVPTVAQIREKIHKLYLVFHYPQYNPFPVAAPVLGTPAGQTVFDIKVANTPEITDTKAVFNYVISDAPGGGQVGGGKRLLSTAGIVKKDMVNLKIVIDKLEKAATEDAFNKVLFETSDAIAAVAGRLMGGNNNNNTSDILLKNTGGKNNNNNRSNKRIKKQPRRRNKSSKSIR